MNNLEKHFVNYQQSVELKSIKFNEPCLGYYNCERDFIFVQGKTNFLNCEIPRPLKSQIFKWGRDKHKVQSIIQEYMLNTYMYTIDDGINSDISIVGFETFEEAESNAIDKLIEIVKNK